MRFFVLQVSLNSLNNQQRLAATHIDGPMLVLAGPGSGKTRVVTHRVAHLICEGVPPEQIVALSFTNKAADEMRRRVTQLIGPQPVEMGTFHRFSARFLRHHARFVGLTSDYSILDTDDSKKLLRRAAKSIGLPLTHTPVDRLAGVISRAKNDFVSPHTFEPRWGHPEDDIAARVWPLYQRMLLENNAVDFDDLLVHVARVLTEQPELRSMLDARHRWILVDEYQDTNAVQYMIVHALSIDHPNLSVTGDPDQAIYGWRGASIRNILEFERDYPTARIVKLERNYRSTSNILGTADRLIAHNTKRKPKILLTDAPPGAPVRIVLDSSSRDEADRIANEIQASVVSGRRKASDHAILFRTNALSRSFEVALRTRGVAYQLVRGLEFFKRKEIKDVVAWLRLLRNPRDDEAFLRVVNVPARGLGRQSLEALGQWADDQKVSRLEAAGKAFSIQGISSRARGSLGRFVQLHDELSSRHDHRVADLLEAVLDRTGYRAMLEREEDEEGEDRLANIEELLTAARELDEEHVGTDALEAFLETTALVADTDAWEPMADRVSLMTLHAVKGLEFPVVYIVAMEDGILPHERSLHAPDTLEEERRLVFVGITRGREEVHASCARIRDYRGTKRVCTPSIFLAQLTGDETIVCGSEAPADGRISCSALFDDESQIISSDASFETSEESQILPEHCSGTSTLVSDGPTFESDSREDRPLPKQPSRNRHWNIQSAADLVIQKSVPKSVFHTGQRVIHPHYGRGFIQKVTGTSPKLVGTVIFDGVAKPRTFILHLSGLEPESDAVGNVPREN